MFDEDDEYQLSVGPRSAFDKDDEYQLSVGPRPPVFVTPLVAGLLPELEPIPGPRAADPVFNDVLPDAVFVELAWTLGTAGEALNLDRTF